MKKSTLITALSIVFTLLISFGAEAQTFPKMDKSPMDAASYPSSYKVAEKTIKIVYSRPFLNGRSLEKLAPKGEVWRTGANEAAEITFYKTVKFDGKKIAPGTYTLFTIPNGKNWTIILSSKLNVWGSYFYKQSEDVARMDVPVSSSETSIENFSIAFKEKDGMVHMHMGWGTMRLDVPFAI